MCLTGDSTKKSVVVEGPEDIVIAGMSVRCAQSDNVEEFAKNLFAGVDMVHENLDRCAEDFFGVPKQHGFIRDIRKFDASFFNVHPKQAEGMDPQLRILHEVAYESIIDGGVDPAELKNSNTGVFIGTSNSDAREAWTSADVSEIDGYSLIGTHRAFLANRLSFVFDLRGPSFGVDAACATTGVAINQGYLHMKNGQCDAALVGGVGLVYQPKIAYQIKKLGLLASDGKCKVFDESADGYVRSEAIVCILLQKRKNARRIYATLVHSKINNDGFKDQGVTWPSTESQGQLVAEVYAEAGIDTEDVEYVEAHGTGTKNGDPQETNGIALGFAGTRTKPLPIGAVKSNMGHTEHASGGVATIKVLIAMQAGVIPANLHYKNPNPAIPALMDGRLKVVDKHMKWNATLVGINSFGFGGQNSHIILRGNPNVRKESISDLRLTVYMGRTEDAARSAMEYANRYPDNPHVPYLLMQSAYARPGAMPHRGYTITNGKRPITVVDRVYAEKKPAWWIFSGQGTQWASMGKDMMRLDAFKTVIQKCADILTPVGIDLIKLLTTSTEEELNDTTLTFVGITAVQIALVELFRLMDVTADGFIGHSAGEIGCAYADGCLNMEEALLTAFWRGRAVEQADMAPGAMAAVGLSWDSAKIVCSGYPGVAPACNNGEDNVTVSGSVEEVARLVADLQEQKVFAKEVNSSGVAFHSPAMAKAAEIYYEALKKVLTNAKMRTGRWLSTAVSEDQWTTNLAKFASADYFAHNLASTVKFHEAMQKVPVNAVAVEISPHGLLQAVIRKTVGSLAVPVALMHRDVPDNAIYYLESIGKLYLLGLNPKVNNIFPTPSLPAPRDTPFLGSVVRWDHSASWRIPEFTDFINKGHRTAQHVYNFSEAAHEHFLENVIDNKPRFPIGGFLTLVANVFADENGKAVEKYPKLQFSDLQFWSPVMLDKEKKVDFTVVITKKTGNFEVTLDKTIVLTGFVTEIPDQTTEIGAFPTHKKSDTAVLDSVQVYDELQFRGYGYGPNYRLIKSISADGTSAVLQHPSAEQTIDGLLQLAAFNTPTRDLQVPHKIRSIRIDIPASGSTKSPETSAKFIRDMDLVATSGLEIEGISWETVAVTPAKPNLQEIVFTAEESSYQSVAVEPASAKLAHTGVSSVAELYHRVVYALISRAKATTGQSILINAESPADKSQLGIVVRVAKKLGLDVSIAGLTQKQENGFISRLPVKSENIHYGDLSDITVAQKVKQSTGGSGFDIVYNVIKLSKLSESLRVTAPGATYIEGLGDAVDNSALFSAVSKNVTVHLAAGHRDDVTGDKAVAEFLANCDFGLELLADHETKGSRSLFRASKHYIIAAGTHETTGFRTAYWLATHGAENVHLHFTTKPTTGLQTQMRFFEHLNVKLTTYSATEASAESTVQAVSKIGDIGGVFVLQSDAADVTLIEKLSSGKLAENWDSFVVITGYAKNGEIVSDSVAKTTKTIQGVNSAGKRGVLLNIPSLDDTASVKGMLESLLTMLHRGKGIFVLGDENGSKSSPIGTADGDIHSGVNLPQAVAKIMGIKDFKSLDQFLSLGDYGIDSLMVMELSAVLEQDFDIYLTLQEIRSLSIGDIVRMSGSAKTTSTAQTPDSLEKPTLLDTAVRHYNLKEIVPKSPIALLRKVQNSPGNFFMVHPMEGSVVPVLESLGNHLQVTTYGLNCTADVDLESMVTLAAGYIKEVKKVQPTGPYNIGGYSFGAGVAFEMALQLQKEKPDQVKNLILLDGSHSFVAAFTKGMKTGYTVTPGMTLTEMDARKQTAFETAIFSLFVTQLVKTKRQPLSDKLSAAGTFEDRISIAVKELQNCPELTHISVSDLRKATVAFARRLTIADTYRPEEKFDGRVTLIKCTDKMIRNLGEFYGLEKVCSHEEFLQTVTVPGNHEGFVQGENSRLTAEHINYTLLGTKKV